MATILEKRFKAWLNIKVHLRHVGCLGLEFVLKTECDSRIQELSSMIIAN